MKKLIPIILSLAMIFSLSSCGGNSTTQDDESQSQVQTDDSAQTDEDTPANENSPTDEDTSSQDSSLWDISYYVDDFNQPTEDAYICSTTAFPGTFSNSATTDSLVYAHIAVDKDDISIFLYEYGSNQVKNSSSYNDDIYNIKMRTADGTDYNFTGTIYCGSDRIIVDPEHRAEVIDALSQEGNITTTFYIEDAEHTTTHYLFAVVSNNFAEKYQELYQ